MQDFTKKLRKRLLPLYIAAFFQGFVLWYAIEKVFMKSIGFNDETIAIEVVILTVVMLVANIPMGVLADRWSRKGVLMLASLALMLSSLIGGLSVGFWMYVITGSLWGLFFAAYAGTYDSVVYDVLVEETGNADGFERHFGRVQIADSIALGLSALLSSVIAHAMNLRIAYLLSIPPTVASLIALYYFREPKEHKKGDTELMGTHIKATFRAIAQKGEVLWIVLTLILLTIDTRLMYEFFQLWFIALTVPLVLFGPLTALLVSSSSVGGFLAGKLRGKLMLLVGAALASGSLALLIRQSLLIVIAQTAFIIGLIMLDIVLGRYLHDALASKVRAGASSVVTTFGYIAFLPAAFVFGAVSKQFSVFRAAWIVVAVGAATIVCMSVVVRHRERAIDAA